MHYIKHHKTDQNFDDHNFSPGTPVSRIPIMAKQILDLFQLYHLVVKHGGLVQVNTFTLSYLSSLLPDRIFFIDNYNKCSIFWLDGTFL